MHNECLKCANYILCRCTVSEYHVPILCTGYNSLIYNMKKDIENCGNDGSSVFTLSEFIEALNNNSIDVESGIGYFGNNLTISDMRAYTDTEYIESMKHYYNFVHWYPDKND